MLKEYIGSTFSNSGWWFTIRNFWANNGNSALWVWGICAVLCIWKFGEKTEKYVFSYFFAIYLFLTLNPLIWMEITEHVEGTTQNRLYYAFPAHLIVGIATVIVFRRLNDSKKVYMVLALLCIGCFCVGDITFWEKHSLPENIYYCPDEVIEISEILHEESKEDKVVALILHAEYKAYMRQYDASIYLPVAEYVSMNDLSFSVADIDNYMSENEAEFVVVPIGYIFKDGEVDMADYDYELIEQTTDCNIYRYLGE